MAKSGRKAKTEAERAFDVQLGRRVAIARKELEMTGADLAARVGISTQQLYKYEWGEDSIPLRRLIAFCRILHVSLASMVQTTTFSLKSENSCAGCRRNR